MALTFYFYDLETSGFNPRVARIMQFGGQRTDLDLNPIGEPVNQLIMLTPDVLPDPDAILVTGITPQQTLKNGVSEAEFLKFFHEQIATPGTIFVGFNSVRFDDEFMRFLNYRNFYDPYEWQWKDDKSRWDLLDVVRMTRALRPAGIKWPVDEGGKATNRLELFTKSNNLLHADAHDALSDALATIEVAKLIKTKQPKLFDFLLENRGKKSVAKLVSAGKPFVYTSGKYPGEYEKTTIAAAIAETPGRNSSLVYDLRFDPTEFAALTPQQLAEAWRYKKEDEQGLRLPIKTLRFNVCPAVAPLNVLDAASQKRLKLDMKMIAANLQKLKKINRWPEALFAAQKVMDEQREESAPKIPLVDSQLYDGFFNDHDRKILFDVRNAEPAKLASLDEALIDKRLKALLPLYKARNFPESLTAEEKSAWQEFIQVKLTTGGEAGRLTKFQARIKELEAGKTTESQKVLLKQLKTYAKNLSS